MKKVVKVILLVVLIALALLLSPFLFALFFVFVKATGNFGLLMLNIFVYGCIVGMIALMLSPFASYTSEVKNGRRKTLQKWMMEELL